VSAHNRITRGNVDLSQDLDEIVYGRRTIRHYSDKKIAPEVYEELISAAVQAPSACNRQEWRFLVVEDKRLLHWLFEEGGATFIDHVPQGILVLHVNRTDNKAYWDPIQSAAAAIMLLQLKAYALGIGSCWVCHLPPKREIRRKFNIPSYYDPIAFVTLGYWTREPARRPRKVAVKSLLAYNRFAFDEPPLPVFDVRVFLRLWARRLYYLFPWRKHLYPWVRKYEKKFYD
jgi:nitroreductase